jgi:hypothetical protein
MSYLFDLEIEKPLIFISGLFFYLASEYSYSIKIFQNYNVK